MKQMDLAKNEMVRWLSYPSELGKSPAKIECTNHFNYLDMIYYIFKFKTGIFDSEWKLGVCGGYEENATEHCGHIFSDYRKYNPSTEIDDATEIIEMIRQYRMQRAKDFMNNQ